jgi:hypothetical protein
LGVISCPYLRHVQNGENAWMTVESGVARRQFGSGKSRASSGFPALLHISPGLDARGAAHLAICVTLECM